MSVTPITNWICMASKVSEVRGVVKKGIEDPNLVFSEIRKMAENYDWKVREIAATALVEISKKREDAVVEEMMRWASDGDLNIRRVSSEGLRGVARKNPKKILPVLEKLKMDSSLYVKKSVASLLRNASRKHPDFVMELCGRWIKLNNPNTNWIITDGLRKLKENHPRKVNKILKLIE